MEVTADRFVGCLLGLSLGDALGAPYEGGVLERAVWRVIGRTPAGEMRWTDDTQMSVDLLESLLATAQLDLDDVAARFARSYRWTRGYGPATARLLKKIARGANWREASRSTFRGGSFGNGAAMRAPIIGLAFATRPGELVEAACKSATITHSHPLGIEGAVLIAHATAWAAGGNDPPAVFRRAATACAQEQFTARLAIANAWLDSGHNVPPSEAARQLGNGITAHESCVTSLYAAVRFLDRPFLDMHRFITAGGGDVDTIGAMAGAIWGAANGSESLPAAQLSKLEQREKLENLALALHRLVNSRSD
ncbi:MAG: ADP-ribosylglycohydrolase family protein [Phycisphaerales bacterium]|nr:ADP-ribosylglycohydrolase family protein [Phycisphaerales bacterium]